MQRIQVKSLTEKIGLSHRINLFLISKKNRQNYQSQHFYAHQRARLPGNRPGNPISGDAQPF